MATKSILKNIEIKDKKLGNNFADALEAAFIKAENDTNKKSDASFCTELTGMDINKFFNL